MGKMPVPDAAAGGEAGAPGGLGGFLPSDLFSRKSKHGKNARKKKDKKKKRR
jgi:hypothetical protein